MKMVTVGPIGCSAVGEAAKGLGEKFNDLRLGVVFLPHDADCDASIKAIKAALPNVPVVGCTSGSYAFTQRGGTTNGACMGFIRGNDIHVELGKIERYSGDIKEDAKKAIDAMKPFESKRHTLLTFTDYYGFDGSAFGDALDEILPGDWCVLGGLAGDGMLMSGDAKVFCNDKVIKRGAVMARIDCDSQPGMVARHGFEITEPDEQFSVTECKGNVIYGLNGMPAVDAYCDALKRIGVLNDSIPFPGLINLAHPLGYTSVFGEGLVIRTPLMIKGKGLAMGGSFPPDKMVHICRSNRKSMTEIPGVVSKLSSKSSRSNREEQFHLVIDCAVRHYILGKEYLAQVGNFRLTNDMPMLGFASYGEIMRSGLSSNCYHNCTAVSCVW